MALNIPNIPPNAVEMLFVEDLIKWLFQRQADVRYETENAGRYRKFILNVFNEDVRQAVNFIDSSVEMEVDEYFSALEELSENTFLVYAIHCEEIHFRKEFQADCFLEYCVRLVSMAIRFANCNVPQTISMSFHIILQLLKDRGMFPGGWDTLIEVAKKYAKIFDDYINAITPETSDDETAAKNSGESPARSSEDSSQACSSDYELQTNSSPNSLDMNKENQICDYASNRDQLQMQEREFQTNYLSVARVGLLPERSSKATTNASFDSLEGRSSIKKLLPSISEKSNVSSTSKLVDKHVKIQRETV